MICRTTFILVAFIFVLVLMLVPTEYLPLDTRDDKYHHFFLFSGLTLLANWLLRCSKRLLLVCMLTLASISELSQMLIPYRSSNWLDFQADLAGIAIGIMVIVVYRFFDSARDKLTPCE